MFQYDPRFSRQLHEERVVGPDYAHLAPSGEDSRTGTAEHAGMARIRRQVEAGVRDLRERGLFTLADDLQLWMEQRWAEVDVPSELAG
jgi:hypothetical protein